MKHHVTIEIKTLLEALGHIGQRVRPRLERASPAAREEWATLLASIPSDEDVAMGVIGLSRETLVQMMAKARRFEQILRDVTRADAAAFQQASANLSASSYPDKSTS
jgi:hypothetical protein